MEKHVYGVWFVFSSDLTTSWDLGGTPSSIFIIADLLVEPSGGNSSQPHLECQVDVGLYLVTRNLRDILYLFT